MANLRTREERAVDNRRHLRTAQRQGWVVSQRADDLMVHESTSTHELCHLTTLRRGTFVRFLSCEVWSPAVVCPCGQLTVRWKSWPMSHGEGREGDDV
jgi:hypothetical protein